MLNSTSPTYAALNEEEDIDPETGEPRPKKPVNTLAIAAPQQTEAGIPSPAPADMTSGEPEQAAPGKQWMPSEAPADVAGAAGAVPGLPPVDQGALAPQPQEDPKPFEPAADPIGGSSGGKGYPPAPEPYVPPRQPAPEPSAAPINTLDGYTTIPGRGPTGTNPADTLYAGKDGTISHEPPAPTPAPTPAPAAPADTPVGVERVGTNRGDTIYVDESGTISHDPPSQAPAQTPVPAVDPTPATPPAPQAPTLAPTPAPQDNGAEEARRREEQDRQRIEAENAAAAGRLTKLNAAARAYYAANKKVEVPTETYDAENNIINEAVLPSDSDRVQRLSAMNDAQTGNIANIDRAALVGDEGIQPTDSSDLRELDSLSTAQTKKIGGLDRQALAKKYEGQKLDTGRSERFARLRAAEDAQLEKIRTGPDRVKKATSDFDRFSKDTAPEYDLARRQALNDAGNFGYTGSGRLVTRYGDLDLARERDLDSQKYRLSSKATDDSINDDRYLLNTLSSLTNNEAGYSQADLENLRKERDWTYDQGDSEFGMELTKGNTISGQAATRRGAEVATRNERRSERAFRSGEADKIIRDQYDKGNYLTNQEGDVRDVEIGQRNEVRGERGNQQKQAQQALLNKFDALKLQDQLTQSEFDRNKDRTDTGYGDDPTGALGGAAGGEENAGDMSAAEMKSMLEYLATLRKQRQQPKEG